MADKNDSSSVHGEAVPLALEMVVMRLRELETVIGPHAAPTVAAVTAALIEAMAARDRGDAPESIRRVGEAMDRLAGLADRLDPAEAALMRSVAQTFRAALLRGDHAQAQQQAAAMFERSGALPLKDVKRKT